MPFYFSKLRVISQLLICHSSSKYVFFHVNVCPEKQTGSLVGTVLFLLLSSASHPQSSASPPEAIRSSGSRPGS